MTRRRGWTSAVAGIASRQTRVLLKSPALLIPSLLFPMLFFAALAGGLAELARVPGFDYPAGYTSFQFVFVLFQASMFGGVFTGFAAARDFESGFARRLLLAVPHRSAILVGYVVSAMVRAAIIMAFVTVVALLAGLDLIGSPLDVGLLFALALLSNILGSLWALGIALRFRTMNVAPLMQVPFFVLLFLAPVYVPLDLLSGWIREIADVNPVTFLLEAGRALLVGEAGPVGTAWLVILIGGIILGIWSLAALRSAERG